MRKAVNAACALGELAGIWYALCNTLLYYDSAMGALQGAHAITQDDDEIYKTQAGIIAACCVGLLLCAPLFVAQANTYGRKAARHFGKREGWGLPAKVAAKFALAAALVKPLISNFSTSIKMTSSVLALIANQTANTNASLDVSDQADEAIKMSAFAVMSLATLPSMFYVYYSILFGEAKTKSSCPKVPGHFSTCFRQLDKCGGSAATASIVHGTVANTPGVLMYVFDGAVFTDFVCRMGRGESIDQYVAPIWLTALSYSLHAGLASIMELAFNVRYAMAVQELHDDLDGQADSDLARVQSSDCQTKLVERYSRCINGTSSVYKAFVMASSMVLFSYILLSNSQAFDAGEMEMGAGIAAGATGLISFALSTFVMLSFLFEKKSVAVSRAIDVENPSENGSGAVLQQPLMR